MTSIGDFFLFGLLGACAVGPALLNLYFNALERPTFPVAELSGVLAGEAVYFCLALLSASIGLLREGIVTGCIKLAASAMLIYFAAQTLRNFRKPLSFRARPGFLRSVLLILLNPNVLLLDLMLVIEAFALQEVPGWLCLTFYWAGVCMGTVAVICSVRKWQPLFDRWRKPLEVTAALFFLLVGGRLAVSGFTHVGGGMNEVQGIASVMSHM